MGQFSYILYGIQDLDALNRDIAKRTLANISNLGDGAIRVEFLESDECLQFQVYRESPYRNEWYPLSIDSVHKVNYAKACGQAQNADYTPRALSADEAEAASLTEGFPDAFTAQIVQGGTGAKTAAGARQNLGVSTAQETLEQVKQEYQAGRELLAQKIIRTPIPEAKDATASFATGKAKAAGVVNLGDELHADYQISLPTCPDGPDGSIRFTEIEPVPDGFKPFIEHITDKAETVYQLGLPERLLPARPPVVVKLAVMQDKIKAKAGDKYNILYCAQSCLVDGRIKSVRLDCPELGISLEDKADHPLKVGQFIFSFPATPMSGVLTVVAEDMLGNQSRPQRVEFITE